MGPFILAWMVGEGIITYRSIKINKCPPGPGQLLITSGLFLMLALLSEVEKARFLATALAWGLDAAAFMNFFNVTGIGKETGESEHEGVGTWPPPQAPNNVVFPTGKAQ